MKSEKETRQFFLALIRIRVSMYVEKSLRRNVFFQPLIALKRHSFLIRNCVVFAYAFIHFVNSSG